MPLLNFDAKLTQLNGTEILDSDGSTVHVRNTVANILAGDPKPGTQPMERRQMGALADKIYAGGDVNLTIPEVNLIRNAVEGFESKGYMPNGQEVRSPLPNRVLTQVLDALDNEITSAS